MLLFKPSFDVGTADEAGAEVVVNQTSITDLPQEWKRWGCLLHLLFCWKWKQWSHFVDLFQRRHPPFERSERVQSIYLLFFTSFEKKKKKSESVNEFAKTPPLPPLPVP